MNFLLHPLPGLGSLNPPGCKVGVVAPDSPRLARAPLNRVHGLGVQVRQTRQPGYQNAAVALGLGDGIPLHIRTPRVLSDESATPCWTSTSARGHAPPAPSLQTRKEEFETSTRVRNFERIRAGRLSWRLFRTAVWEVAAREGDRPPWPAGLL